MLSSVLILDMKSLTIWESVEGSSRVEGSSLRRSILNDWFAEWNDWTLDVGISETGN